MTRRRRPRPGRRAGSGKARRAPRRYSSTDFDPDYTHVIQDLRRIGLLASSFLVILVVLSFFLN
jgi:hypothetical protein